METLLFWGIVALVVYWVIKKRGAPKPTPAQSSQKPEIKFTVSVGTPLSNSLSAPDTGPTTRTPDGSWIINPKSSRPLTLLDIDQQTAQKIKTILDQTYSMGTYNQVRALVPIIARSNVRCKEIDAYIEKFKPQYLKAIEQLKQASSEWATASEKDREDLMSTFRDQAISQLDIRPYCDLETLFECEPSDASLDDSLVDRFGFDSLQLYLRHADNLDKVRIIPADHHDRAGFEKLVEIGLATRGQSIPPDSMLETLKLKDMKDLVADLSPPPFRKKSQAVEYLLSIPDLPQRLGKVLAFRELFKLSPLPTEFSHIDLQKISASWKYVREVSSLLAHTYLMGGYSFRDKEHYREDLSFVTGWELLPANDDNCCSYCKRAANVSYTKNKRPIVPLHIGCRCSVSPKIRSS